jgi:hypothetical protein
LAFGGREVVPHFSVCEGEVAMQHREIGQVGGSCLPLAQCLLSPALRVEQGAQVVAGGRVRGIAGEGRAQNALHLPVVREDVLRREVGGAPAQGGSFGFVPQAAQAVREEIVGKRILLER